MDAERIRNHDSARKWVVRIRCAKLRTRNELLFVIHQSCSVAIIAFSYMHVHFVSAISRMIKNVHEQ